MKNPCFLSHSITFVALAAALPAQAAEISPWELPAGFHTSVGGSQTASYDSNPLRVTTGGAEIYGSTTSPELVMSWKTPRSTILSQSRVDANFFDDADYNSVDFHQKLLLLRQNQRWSASVEGRADYDTTRTSELTNYALNLSDVHRTYLSAAPQLAFQASERDRLLLMGSAASVSYDNTAYSDYTSFFLSPTYEHKFTPNNTGRIAFTGQRYESLTGAKLISDSYGPSIGWTSIITPQWTLNASAGALATEKRGVGAGTEDRSVWNYVFSGTAAYKGEADTFDFTATRARTPFGNGTETLLTSFEAKERHALTPSVALTAEARYQTADSSAQAGVNLDEGYALGAGAEYQWTPEVSLTANYHYRNETLTHTQGKVDQHVAMLGVTLHPSWSK